MFSECGGGGIGGEPLLDWPDSNSSTEAACLTELKAGKSPNVARNSQLIAEGLSDPQTIIMRLPP